MTWPSRCLRCYRVEPVAGGFYCPRCGSEVALEDDGPCAGRADEWDEFASSDLAREYG